MSTPSAQSHDTLAPSRASKARLIFRLVLVLAILGTLSYYLAPHWVRVMAWGLEDNDDAMRVLQVRDWLSGQAWFDVSQHRLNPPQGGDMHWSRIADLPLAALMAPLSLLFGSDLGAKYAAFFTPVILGVAYVWMGARTATSLAGKNAFLPGVILLAVAPAAFAYFLPGRVDHHGLQMMLIAGALWGIFNGGGKSAALAGVAIATGICIGLDALPLQIVLIGWVATRWGFRGQSVKAQTIGFASGFACALAMLFVLTVPMAKWSLPVNDAIGRGYVVLGCLGGLLLAGAGVLFSKLKLTGRFGILCGIGLIVLSGITAFPEIIIPPYGKVDPLLTRLWLNNVNETEPFITTKLSRLLGFTFFPVLASIGSLACVAKTKDKERDLWILAAMAVIVGAALAIFWQSRVGGLATALSSIIAAAMIAKAFERFGWKIALIIALVLNPVLPSLAGAGIAKLFEKNTQAFTTGGGQNCFTQASFASLKNNPTGLVIAPIDMGARILLTTPHSALAAPYHRNNRGNLAAYQVFIMPQAEARIRTAQLGGTYIAICKRSAEVAILAREGPKGLMADLKVGRVPDWLIPLPTPKGSDVQAFKVK